MPPDDIFIRSLDASLSWPIETTRASFAARSASQPFSRRLQEWMTEQGWELKRGDVEEWGVSLLRAAQTLVHLLANRLIFYQALRARFQELPRLQLRGVSTAAQAYAHLQRLFERAVALSGDYEPLFYPEEKDWAGRQIFEGAGAIDAWQKALRGIERYDFGRISSDIVGKVFQRLVSPEERHRWGQHFTGDDVVDLINSFSLRHGSSAVLDPACGSGSFLVRAYYRKQWLEPKKSHLELLSELFGCDIALYPAHLATLNLAAREINDEANYPRITRRDFFEVDPAKPFCTLPPDNTVIMLPKLGTIVGNPPYLRQENFGSRKEKLREVVESQWPGLRLSGRSDIHCYFWPAAAAMLAENGYFGFLTSSSWLDVEYGFILQRWILQNFKIIAVMESAAEPWFEDARVKTCATILQRCADANERGGNLVRFVRVKRPLAEIIGHGPSEPEARFMALDALRDRVLSVNNVFEDESIRVIAKAHRNLWSEGQRASGTLGRALTVGDSDEDGHGESTSNRSSSSTSRATTGTALGDYAAGKWGRYLRAPAIYFEIMREFGSRFVPLGEIVTIRFGVKSGCDDFFMPHDITSNALNHSLSDREFGREYRVERAAVESGTVKIIRAGDGSKHPIEARYLRPEVHSLMSIDRAVVTAADFDRVILLVGEPVSELKGTLVAEYLRFGERMTFSSSKSKAVPVPKRSTCASRERWYDLTKLVKPGFAFWPMAQQYRHIVAHNPEGLVCNHNLFDISNTESSDASLDESLLAGILNSTLVGIFKTFYGRFAGTEGNLKTEVVDVKLLEVPDPRTVSADTANRVIDAFHRLRQRPIGRLVEEQLMDCHSPERAEAIAAGPLVLPKELRRADRRELDDAVFELLGISDPHKRDDLIDRLYVATAAHFREIRVVEIQKMEQRSKSKSRRYSIEEIATDAWNAVYFRDEPPLVEWFEALEPPKVSIAIPLEGAPRLVDEHSMFDKEIVYFGSDRSAQRVVCSSRAQAELVAQMAKTGLRGTPKVPDGEEACRKTIAELKSRLDAARREFETIASERSADDKRRAEIVDLMMAWRIHGKLHATAEMMTIPAVELQSRASPVA